MNPVSQQMEALKQNPAYRGGVGFCNPFAGGTPPGTPSENVPTIRDLTLKHSATKDAFIASQAVGAYSDK